MARRRIGLESGKISTVSKYQTDQGVCLRVVDFSETSQVVTLLTREHGLISALAKGIRKISSKSASPLGGPLDLLSVGEIVFVLPRSGELSLLTAWQVANHQPAIRTNLAAFYAGEIICEFTSMLLSPHDPHTRLYDELIATLQLITQPEAPRALVAYLTYALNAAGYQARLDICCVCGSPVRPGAAIGFIPSHGTVACASCRVHKQTIKVEASIVLALHRLPAPSDLQKHPPSRPADVTALLAAAKMLYAQVQALTDRRPRTADLLADAIKTSVPESQNRNAKRT